MNLEEIIKEVGEAAHEGRMISGDAAHEIALTWMGPSAPAINRFAQSGDRALGLEDEICVCITKIEARPKAFEDGPWLEDVGGAQDNIAMLKALLCHVQSARGG